jgi:hypothetical protein
MESKKKVAEGKSFSFAEKESRRKIFCSPRMESKEKVERGKRFSHCREGEQEEKLFPKNEVKKRRQQRGKVFPLQRRRAGGKFVSQEWSEQRR